MPACRKAALEEGHLRTKMRTCVSFLPTCIAIRKRLVRQLAVSGANQPAVARLQVHKYIDTVQERKEKVVLYPWFLFVSRVISSSSTYIQYRDDLLQISRTTHQSTSQRRHSISQLIVYHRARTTSIWETKKVFRYIKGGARILIAISDDSMNTKWIGQHRVSFFFTGNGRELFQLIGPAAVFVSVERGEQRRRQCARLRDKDRALIGCAGQHITGRGRGEREWL